MVTEECESRKFACDLGNGDLEQYDGNRIWKAGDFTWRQKGSFQLPVADEHPCRLLYTLCTTPVGKLHDLARWGFNERERAKDSHVAICSQIRRQRGATANTKLSMISLLHSHCRSTLAPHTIFKVNYPDTSTVSFRFPLL